jgi:DHA2 family multidrug resistance protein
MDVMMQPGNIASGRKTLILAASMAATSLQSLDTSIANVALPHMQGTMGATQDQISWVLTSYLVASAIGLTLTPTFTARLGRTRYYVLAVSAFTVASMMCGLSQTLGEIVVSRGIQGFAGGALLPLSQSVIIDLYPSPDKRTAAMSAWSLGVLMGPIMGPTIGGYLTDALSWRWVFFINLPAGSLAAIGLALSLPETPRSRDFRFDTLGFLLLGIGVSVLQIMLDRGETLDWFSSQEICLEAAIAGTCLYLFAVHMVTAKQPFISRALFRDMNFVVTSLLTTFIFLAQYSITALLPLMMQTVMNYPPNAAGGVMSSRGLGAIMAAAMINRFARYTPRLTITVGIVLGSLAIWRMSGFTADVSAWDVGISCGLAGMAFGLCYPPLMVFAFTTLDARFTTEASAVSNLIRSLGGSIGISAMMSLFTTNSQVNHQVLSAHITPFSRTVQALADHTVLNLSSPTGLALLNGTVEREAAMGAYIDNFYLLCWMTLVLVPFILLVRTGQGGARPSGAAVQEA